MDIMWILIFFFSLVTIIFVAFAYFFPEWVGITGKKALEINKHQSSNQPSDQSKTDHSENK